MNKNDRKGTSINEGIQANNVNADVLAVGRGASASKSVISNSDGMREELLSALTEIRAAVVDLLEDVPARTEIEVEIDVVEEIVKKDEIAVDAVDGALAKVASKLDGAGVVLSKASAMIEPIKKIGKLIGLSLKFLGL